MEPNLAEAERRIEEARRTGAEWLDLGDLGLRELPASVGGLEQLKALYLGMLKPSGTGELEWDQKREVSELKDLSALSGLAGLQSLDLSWCRGVTGLSPVSDLAGLQSLDLWECSGVTDLSPLSGLAGLQSLNLSGCRGVTGLSPLSGLAGLQSLSFGNTGVTDLSPLSSLAGLQSLSFGKTGVTELSALSDFRNLETLNLYSCGASISLELLRIFVHHPRLNQLIADKAAGVPREVLSRKLFSREPFSHLSDDNCLPRLRTYLAELDHAAEAENEVKVILLGNGRVGKTQLCRRFRNEPFDKSIESTHGVQIWRKELRLKAGNEEHVFQVNWWDFGGQDIYHGTHALFLRNRAVFLILWTPELENRNEYEENGIPLRNQPLTYWLDYVRTLAGEDSPVIVVQSQCDRFGEQRPALTRPDGFGFFQSCAYSSATDLGRDPLEAQLREAIRYLLDRNGELAIGKGRAEVRRRLYSWRSMDQERPPEQREHRILTLEEFRALCDEVGGIANWEHALDYLHHTGVVFYDPKLFSNCIVLDQDWALDAVYAVFHRGRAAPLLRDSGRFTREDLGFMVWQKHSIEEQRLFLGLMESCGVCFPCGQTSQGEDRYLAPDLLPGFEVVKNRLYAWKEEPGTPALRLEYHFFHSATIRGLMSEIGQQAEELAEYWKYGLWLKDGKRDTQLLVQFENIATDEAPGAGALELKAQGRDPLGLLREIRRSILQQRIGEQPEERLTLEGSTVARSALAFAVDGRVLDFQGQPVSAAFSAFFEDREYEPDEARTTPETRGLDILPQDLAENEKPSVFLSYSRKDSRSLEAFRIMLAPLVRKNVVDVWWDGEIKASQLWREEIDKALASARIGVLLVTPNFLASDFIAKKELPYFMAAAEQKKVKLLWVLVSPCLYEHTPLVEIQAAHDLARPLDSLSKPRRTAVLKAICQKIAEAAASES